MAVVALNIFALKGVFLSYSCSATALPRRGNHFSHWPVQIPLSTTHLCTHRRPGDLQYRLTGEDKDNDKTKSPVVSQLIPKQEEAADSCNRTYPHICTLQFPEEARESSLFRCHFYQQNEMSVFTLASQSPFLISPSVFPKGIISTSQWHMNIFKHTTCSV